MKKFRYPIIILILAVDQLVKYIIRANFEIGESLDFGRIFSITYLQNSGAAFSTMEGKTVLLLILPLIATAAFIWYMEINKDAHWTMYLAISMVISGGLGNAIDRAVFGFVTDMFDFHFWPVFNVADIAIVCGCFLLVIYVFWFDKKDGQCKETVTHL